MIYYILENNKEKFYETINEVDKRGARFALHRPKR